jgi:PAS domain-containing protein
MTELTFSIGEVAAMLGISPHTIRAWERRHLMVTPVRTASGQRRYSADDVELLRQIKHERHVHGLSMRVATMTAQGLIVPDRGEASGPDGDAGDLTAADGDSLRMVANLVPEIVIILDQEGRFTYANTQFVRFSEVLQGQLRGMQFADFVDPFDRAKAVQTYQSDPRQRRGWELNLRSPRRLALFSFDCWPVRTSEGRRMVLIGTDLSAAPGAAEVFDDALADASSPSENIEGGARPVGPRVPRQLRQLLEWAADPVRTVGLFRRWLDATEIGVALVWADSELTVVSANQAFEGWAPHGHLRVEGKPWRVLWPSDDLDRLTSAAEEVIRTAEGQSLAGYVLSESTADAPQAVWDVELRPVTDIGGGVTHLLVLVVDVTAETAISRRLDPLVALTSAFRAKTGPLELLRAAVRNAQDLVPNDGAMAALAPEQGQDTVNVVVASGVWSGADDAPDRDLRLILVRNVVRTAASMELEWNTGSAVTETLRIVPLLGSRTLAEGKEALGALAFARLGPSPFPAEDCQLIDELGGRLGMALERADPPAPTA